MAGGRRAYVNSQTHEGESALYLAAQHGHLAAVRPLLRACADVNQLTNDRSCALYAAVDGGHKEIVQLLVSEGAEVNGTHTACCWTCLHLAVYKGYEEILRILVGVCRLETVDDHNITPLFVAAQYGRHGCLEILANAGANVNAQAADLATPLMLASQEGHERCLEVLLDHGADPNLPCSNDWPQLPIHAAAEFGHRRILERLIAVTDRACDRAEGMVSPMYMAVKRSGQSMMGLLLRAGYSPDAQDCSHSLGGIMLYFLLFPGVCSALHYYYVVDTAMTWMDAQSYCREHYDDLATIDSLEDQQRLEEAAQGFSGSAWIGLYDDVKSWTCLFLIDEKMTWLEAQSYCREHFTDLVSIRDENEYKVVAEK
ncbi:hypothetical protein CRUP_010318, partial [Coryphaenoides rupestris]